MMEPFSSNDDPIATEDLYRLLVEQTREVLCLHDMEARFLYVSPAASALLGYEPAELLGRDPYELVHPEDKATYAEALQKVLAGTDIPVLTVRMKHAGGEHLWLEIQTRPLRDPAGEVARLVTSTRDVSERVRLIERVSERESTLRSVLGSFDDLVFLFGPEGRFEEYYQPSKHPDLFASPKEFLGRHFAEALPPDIAEPVGAAFDRARRGGTAQEVEYELPISGSPQRFHAKVTPMLDSDGGVRGFVCVVRNVTGRRAAEEARVALVRATERAERLEGLSALARGTAHEFNNLLTTIQGNVSLASEELGGSEVGGELAAAIEATKRATKLTQRLLRYAGESLGRMEPVEPAEVIREIEANVRSELSGSAVFDVTIEPEVPRIRGDRGLIGSAVRNLVRNAFESLHDGGGHVRLRLDSGSFTEAELAESPLEPRPSPGEFVIFEVVDDGEGIAAELLPRILDPFVSSRFLGRGLGLAEVAGTIRSHDGAILISSREGEGTSVRMLLPPIGRDGERSEGEPPNV